MARVRLLERIRRLEKGMNKENELKVFIAYTNEDGTLTCDGKVYSAGQFAKCHEDITENKFVVIL